MSAGADTPKATYLTYAKQTGHDPNCAWVQWVVDEKFYPNPGCTCCRYVQCPPMGWRGWVRGMWNRVKGVWR